MKTPILLLSIVLIGCAGKDSDNLESKLKKLAQAQIKNSLKSPESYKPGEFRFITTQIGKEYPFLIDSLYMEKDFTVNGEDTVYRSGFSVQHMCLAKNSFNAEIKMVVQVDFDSHLRFEYIRELTERDQRNYIRRMEESGYKVEPLQWHNEAEEKE